MVMRGNQKLTGGCCPEDANKHELHSGKDVRLRDDQVRVSPHLRRMLSAKVAARALAKREKERAEY